MALVLVPVLTPVRLSTGSAIILSQSISDHPSKNILSQHQHGARQHRPHPHIT